MAFDYFLRIDGIQGESADAKHKGQIEVESFSWGETQTTAAAGGGGGAGRTVPDPLNVEAVTSKASPQLLLACASGQHFRSAVLTGRKAGKEQLEFLTFSLTDVLVRSYHVSGSQSGPPTDSVELTFGRIQVEYKEQKADGSLGPSTKAGWDFKTNAKV